MKKLLEHEGTAKFIGVSFLVGSLFVTLTGCADNDASADPGPSEVTASATAEPTVEADETEFPGRFLSAVEGDTAEIQPVSPQNGDPVGDPLIVKMLGIDAPALGECGGEEAKAELERIIKADAPVLVKYDEEANRTDEDSNTQAYVYFGPSDLASRMVSAGYANAWYPSSETEPERFAGYKVSADAAKDQARGAWATCDTVGR